jgi:hypothetical protein
MPPTGSPLHDAFDDEDGGAGPDGKSAASDDSVHASGILAAAWLDRLPQGAPINNVLRHRLAPLVPLIQPGLMAGYRPCGIVR